MCDELAYYELSHMGNYKIKTPNIDRFARQGIRFTHALAASPVCAPLRCNLMTGKHSGHSSVRKNDGGTPLRADETTIASLLKEQGYATGGFGKWGCGERTQPVFLKNMVLINSSVTTTKCMPTLSPTLPNFKQ